MAQPSSLGAHCSACRRHYPRGQWTGPTCLGHTWLDEKCARVTTQDALDRLQAHVNQKMVFCGHCSTAIRREQAQVGSLQEGLCEACWLEDLISAAPVGPAPSAGAAGAVAPVYAGGAGLGGPLSGATARSPTPSPMVPTGVAPSLARAPGVPAAPASHLDRLDPASQAAHSAAAAQEHARALHTQTRLHPGAGGPNGAGRVAPLGGGGQMSIAELMAATTQNASSGPRGHGHQATPSSPMSSTYGTSDEALQFDLTVLVDLRHASHGTLNAKQDFSKDLIVLGNTSMRDLQQQIIGTAYEGVRRTARAACVPVPFTSNDVSLEINGKSVFVAEWGDNSLAAYDLAYPFPAPARPGGPGASRARKSAALTRQPGKAGKVKVTVHLDLYAKTNWSRSPTAALIAIKDHLSLKVTKTERVTGAAEISGATDDGDSDEEEDARAARDAALRPLLEGLRGLAPTVATVPAPIAGHAAPAVPSAPAGARRLAQDPPAAGPSAPPPRPAPGQQPRLSAPPPLAPPAASVVSQSAKPTSIEIAAAAQLFVADGAPGEVDQWPNSNIYPSDVEQHLAYHHDLGARTTRLGLWHFAPSATADKLYDLNLADKASLAFVGPKAELICGQWAFHQVSVPEAQLGGAPVGTRLYHQSVLSLKNADPAGHTCARLVNEVEYRLHRQNYRSTDLVRAFVPGLCRLRIAELVEASGAAVFIARFGLRGYIEEVEDKTPGEATDAWALSVPRVVPAYLCRDMESIPAEHRQGARLAVAGMTKLYGNMNLDATIALEALVRPSPFPADQPMPKLLHLDEVGAADKLDQADVFMLAVYEQTASLQHYLLSTVGVLYYDIHGAAAMRRTRRVVIEGVAANHWPMYWMTFKVATLGQRFIEADGGPSCIDAWSDIHVCNRICTLLRLLPVDKLRAHLDRQRAEQSAALHARLRAEQAGDDIGDGDGGALFREPSVASEEPISVGEEDANMTFVDGVAAALRKHARADSSDSAAEPQEPPASDDDAKAAKGVAPKTTTSNSTKASTPKTTLPTAPATDRIGTRSVVASRAAAGAGTGAAADGRQDDESLAASTSTAAPPPKKAKKKAVA